MSRRTILGLALVLLLAAGLLVWWALSGPPTQPPSRQFVAGLQDTVSIGWTKEHTAVVEASTDADALRGLGYVHGMTRSWTVTLWRRTALGQLSALFGKNLAPIDRHVRKLGFAHHARRAYTQLSSSTRQRLKAYVRGLNAALRSKRVQHRAPFLFFSLTPKRWRPWHALAVERLLAWMGTALPAKQAASAVPRRFVDADRRLRRWLHLHGWTRSLAWAARPRADTTRPLLFARHVLGNTAAPVLQELVLRRPNPPSTVLATLPGTLLFPTGTSGPRSWSYLLGSPLRLERRPIDTTNVRTRHERIRPANGDERLVTVRQYDGGLLLEPPSSDTTTVLHWPGFRPLSDLSHWTTKAKLAAPTSSDPSGAQLYQGVGLTVDSAGTWTVRGEPPVVERGPNTILIGRSSWARHQADALRAHRAHGPLRPRRWSASDSSTWAASLLPRMLPDLAPLSGSDPLLDEALSYLRNWTYVYEPSSIGAVVFEKWMQVYRAEIGQRPSPSPPPFFAALRRRRAFRRAVHRLAAQYGTDVRRWRWERVAPDRRSFPVWSADGLVSAELSPLSTTRYAPLERPGRGHASTLSGGPSLVASLPLGPAPTQWDGWMRNSPPTMTVRRLRFEPATFFARPLLSREPPPPVPVTEAPITRTTLLVPAEP